MKNIFAGRRVLWLGDSITQNGQYVSFAEYYLSRRFPEESFDIVSIGLSSETASGLSERDHAFPRPCVHERLGRALERVKPAVVVAMYGINDGIYHPQSADRMRAFQKGIEKLVSAVRGIGAEMVLLTPAPFDPAPVKSTRPKDAPDFSHAAPYVGYDEVLTEYARWERTLAARDLHVIDLHTAIGDYVEKRRRREPQFAFSGDGIHPDAAGHLLMAQTVLDGLGIPAPRRDLDAKLSAVRADPLFDLVDKHRRVRSDAWLPFVGYTREAFVRGGGVGAAEAEAAALQERIDRMRRG